MKKYTFIFFLIFQFSLLYSQKILIEWSGKKIYDNGIAKIYMPYFKNENYSVVGGVPYLSFTKKENEYNNYVIRNLVWEKITEKDIYALDVAFIPIEEKRYVNHQYNSSFGYLSNFLISTFKKEKGDIYRLVSFDIEKDFKQEKITQKNLFIGTTDNPLKQGTFYKIKVDKSGIFKITSKFLKDNGINPSNINPENFRIYGNGGVMLPEDNRDFRFAALQENAIQVVGENDGKWDDGDYAIFYAKGPHDYNIYKKSELPTRHKRHETRIDINNLSDNIVNIYEDYSYYFINFDIGNGKRVQELDIPPLSNTITRYDEYQYINNDINNELKIGRLWIDEPFSTNKSISFTTKTPLLASDNILVRSTIYAKNAKNDNVTFSVNGQNTSYLVSTPSSYKILDVNYSQNLTNITGNNITFNINVTPTSSPLVNYYLDYVEVQYKQDLVYNDGQMNFRDYNIVEGSGDTFGFTMSNANNVEKIWDVSDITNAKSMVNKSTNGLFSFGYVANSPYFNNEFVAFKNSAAYEPSFVGRIENQDLSSLQNIDYLIITTKDLLVEAERLANYHKTKNNFNVVIVDINKIYNEFSSGSKDITAIRDFITKLNTPSGALKYVLIIGDTTFDFRNKTVNNTYNIPSYQSNFSLDFAKSFVTDDYFVMTSPQTSENIQSIFPDLPIGRIPAQNMAEAKLLIDKTLSYYNALPKQSTPFGDWRMKLNFVVDDDGTTDEEGGYPFHVNMENTLKSVFEGTTDKPEYNVKKLYLDAYPAISTSGGQRYPTINQAITNSMSNSLFLYYFGHGGINGWAQERVLTIQDINSFNNYNNIYSRFPVVSTITCEFTLWDDHNTFSAGEMLLKSPQGGSANMITSSRAIDVMYGRNFTNTFTKNTFKLSNDDFYTLGRSFLDAKIEFNLSPNHLKINLLGDPALKLSRPKKLAVIDNIESPINGQLRALDFVKITGHINKFDGSLDNTFSGKVLIDIFDKKLNKKTLNNDGGMPILDFIEEGSPIVKAAGTATNGNFVVEFYVPKDINYQIGTGRILVYADNNVYDVFNNQNIQIGDINPNGVNDNQPPKVQLFMNNTNFADGGITNTNPNLLACITDDTGINSTGSGVGHDITLILDGEVINTTILNDFYASGSGNGCINTSLKDYQKGSVMYPFQNLKPGPHQLTFKIWDINNNSTTQTLNFVVKDPQTDNLVVDKLLNWPNPFTNKTYIQFEHNCDDVLEVNVQIFTITGKLVKTFSSSVTSSPFLEGYRTNKTAIEWDGTDDFGDTVAKGTYIYKVFVKSQNQDKCKGTSTQVEKMVLLK